MQRTLRTRAPELVRSWLSTHLHFSGATHGSAGDRVVTEVVLPALAELRTTCDVDCFFFVRYGESGPHIRFRVACPAPTPNHDWRSVLDEIIEPLCVAIGVQPRSESYEPEWERYGGLAGMPISENLFESSSIYAAQAAGDPVFRDQRAARRGRALACAVTLYGVFANFDAAVASRRLSAFAKRRATLALPDGTSTLNERIRASAAKGIETVQPFVRELWDALVARRGVPSDIAQWRDGVECARASLSAIRCDGARLSGDTLLAHVEGSYCHMMNNRLGLVATEEAHIAHLAGSALETAYVD